MERDATCLDLSGRRESAGSFFLLGADGMTERQLEHRRVDLDHFEAPSCRASPASICHHPAIDICSSLASATFPVFPLPSFRFDQCCHSQSALLAHVFFSFSLSLSFPFSKRCGDLSKPLFRCRRRIGSRLFRFPFFSARLTRFLSSNAIAVPEQLCSLLSLLRCHHLRP